jgi:hypothetical protein
MHGNVVKMSQALKEIKPKTKPVEDWRWSLGVASQSIMPDNEEDAEVFMAGMWAGYKLRKAGPPLE